MSVYFFDSSALVKRYITEIGTTWVRRTTLTRAGHIIFIAQIAPVEVASALSRRKHEGSIPSRAANAARTYLNRHVILEYETVYLADPILFRAQTLTDQYVLRAMDAIQLASALELQNKLLAANQPSLIFVSADVRLLTVATSEGLQTHNPL